MEDVVKLNKFDLVNEAERQSSSVGYNCEKLGDLDSDISDLKLEIANEKKKLEVKKSKIELRIRSGRNKDFANFKGKQQAGVELIKVTDKALLAYVTAEETIVAFENEIYEQNKKLNEITRDRNKVAAVVEALKQKCKMIELLFKAALMEWYTIAGQSNEKEEDNIDMRKEQRDRARDRRNKN